jgi:hypothetical protein
MTTKLLTLAQAAVSRLSWQVGDHPHSVTTSVTDGDTTATVYEDGPALPRRDSSSATHVLAPARATTVAEAFRAGAGPRSTATPPPPCRPPSAVLTRRE